jgi:four helix bundle protein
MTFYSKQEKESFIESMKARTKKFAIDIIHFCDSLPNTQACRTISFQLIKAATSAGANYRASCRSRSQAEFYSKISVITEEADECQYWLEIIDGTDIKCYKAEIKRVLQEAEDILKICSSARMNSRKI